MRISDWSSDVCSSDLDQGREQHQAVDEGRSGPYPEAGGRRFVIFHQRTSTTTANASTRQVRGQLALAPVLQDHPVTDLLGDRQSVVEGKRVSVRVDLGGHSINTKKKQTKTKQN